MTIIMYELDRIHDTFNRLRFNKLIPCNCSSCQIESKPEFYPYEVLRKFAMEQQFKIQCRKSFAMVNVLSLIDDVIGRKRFIEEEKKRGGNFVFQGTVERFIVQQASNATNVMEEKVTQEKVIQIGNHTTINAPIAIADSIESSFNALAESQLSDKDLELLLTQLLQAVNEVNRNVSPGQAQPAHEMARDAEILVREATSQYPRRKWYEVSLEGLQKAASNIGQLADPVLEIVAKLMPLLLAG